MTCFNPNYVLISYDDYTGMFVPKFKGRARSHIGPEDLGFYDDLDSKDSFSVLVPCRTCLGCRIDYARTWANRMCIELKDNDYKAIFLTLTYKPECVPYCSWCSDIMTLQHRDVQLFLKRLRKHFTGHRIRFYMAGEYGPKGKRPHYHLILFGLTPDDFPDKRIVRYNELGNVYYSSSVLEGIWNKGILDFSSVNYRTCSYVARYTLKKHFRSNWPQLHGAEPEYNCSSRRPGIGMLNYDKYLDSEIDNISIATNDGVHTFPLPKAFVRKGRDCQKIIDSVFSAPDDCELDLSDELDSCFDNPLATLPVTSYDNPFISRPLLSKRVDFCNNLCYNRLKDSNARMRSDLLSDGSSLEEFLDSKCSRLKESLKLLPERK